MRGTWIDGVVRRLAEPFGPRDPRRLHFIDDLRGLAASAVVGFHLLYALPRLEPVAQYGRLGVEVFFVISGFVMARSVGGRSITPRFAGRFMLRRSIRLDPPYWVVLAVTLLVWAVIGWQPLRGPGDVLINAVYLQDILEAPSIVLVAWTLAFELQFYLCFLALLAVCQVLVRRGVAIERARAAVFVSTGIASVALYALWARSATIDAIANLPGLFTPYWFMFVLGVLVQWTLSRELGQAALGLLVAVVLGGEVLARPGGPFPDDDLSAVAALVAVTVVYLAGRTTLLRRGLGFATVAYLGTISYSLYLVHVIVGETTIDAVRRRIGGGSAGSLLATAIGIALSVAAAHLLYVAVEAPSVRLSRRAGGDGQPTGWSARRQRSQASMNGPTSPPRTPSGLPDV